MNSNLFTKKANFEKLGLGIDNPCRIFFFEVANESVLGEG
jgi:antitoxin component of RelBE/YafQ-DinJ toxin-antitoxin module